MKTAQHLRSIISFFIFVGLYAVVLAYLGFVQLINNDFFSNLAEHQYTITIQQLPPRAPILDRTGSHCFALNKECVSAFVIPNQIRNKSALFAFLKEHFPAALDRIEKKPNSSFIYIKRRLNDQERELITQADLSDIHLLSENSRFYPMPSMAPLIGFTDIDNVGCAGIELICNDQLTGTPTQFLLEKDARSGYFYFHKEVQQTGMQSQPVQLTIDANLQFLVDEQVADALDRYQAQEAAAIVMDPTSGELLALSSHPFSNPNEPLTSLEHMKHRAVTESYELGSVIKIAAALAAIEEEVVTPQELIDCKNSKSCIIGGRTINTLTPHGIIPFHDVIALSNNIGMAQVAKRLADKLYDHYTAQGFGTKIGIGLPAETQGFVNHPSNWSAQSIISLSYGYEISISLLQLAALFGMIAHDGKKVVPQLFMPLKKTEHDQLYSLQTIDAIKDMLKRVTEYGTGKRAQMNNFDVMIKTGTANMLVNGKYDSDKHLLSCAGIVEKDGYKRVIVTFVKAATTPNAYAATVAVPLFKRIAQIMVIHDKVV